MWLVKLTASPFWGGGHFFYLYGADGVPEVPSGNDRPVQDAQEDEDERERDAQKLVGPFEPIILYSEEGRQTVLREKGLIREGRGTKKEIARAFQQ